MKTAILVVGALREILLASKSWSKFLAFSQADYHLVTGSTTTDLGVAGDREIDIEDAFRCSVSFKSIHVYERTHMQLGHFAGPWMWKTAHELFASQYERFVIIRPDLCIWAGDQPLGDELIPQEQLIAHGYGAGGVQDQIFVASRKHFEALASLYDSLLKFADPLTANVHELLYGHLRQLDIEVDPVLSQRCHIILARPNSRDLQLCEWSRQTAELVRLRTADWWTAVTGDPYEGPEIP